MIALKFLLLFYNITRILNKHNKCIAFLYIYRFIHALLYYKPLNVPTEYQTLTVHLVLANSTELL